MALYAHNKEISSIHAHNKVISAVYKGIYLVWVAVRSCFGAGMWLREKPWLYNEGWKLGK